MALAQADIAARCDANPSCLIFNHHLPGGSPPITFCLKSATTLLDAASYASFSNPCFGTYVKRGRQAPAHPLHSHIIGLACGQ